MSYLENTYKLQKKIVAITGSNGQIGSALCNAFHESGAVVIGLDLQDSSTKNYGDYYKLDGGAGSHTEDGWFDTGDVATIDPEGYMAITDRTKDVIKSGGEWISSIELENTAMGHPAVAEAAVIGVAHPKWTERPLLVVVKAEGEEISKEEMLAYYEGKVASWWVPTDVAFVDELPHTATGKVKKIELRKQFADYQLPD